MVAWAVYCRIAWACPLGGWVACGLAPCLAPVGLTDKRCNARVSRGTGRHVHVLSDGVPSGSLAACCCAIFGVDARSRHPFDPPHASLQDMSNRDSIPWDILGHTALTAHHRVWWDWRTAHREPQLHASQDRCFSFGDTCAIS